MLKLYKAKSPRLAEDLYKLKNEKVLDIGTGAGFPGLPLRICLRNTKVTLLDSLNKRINFLQEVSNQVGIDNIEFIHGRAEDFAKQMEYREKFDLCVSRAVANLSTLSEYCIPLAKLGGHFIAMKGDGEKELTPAMKAIEKLGGKYESMETFSLPDESKRCLIITAKVKETPKPYPRNGGKIAKAPL